jgi:hypothetical protein
MRSLDDELAALLAELGVTFEREEAAEADGDEATRQRDNAPQPRYSYGTRSTARDADGDDDGDSDVDDNSVSEISLFQSSREHYGVFYRLDLTHGLPQLRIYIPEDEGPIKLRCYLVRAGRQTPLHEWFISARHHEGSRAYEDARDAAQQHLLFAAGELMKRLFWNGDLDTMDFPGEIDVARVA